jgi:hypothetical protein
MIDRSLIRELVMSVIAEEVAAIRKPAAAPAAEPRAAETVRIGSDCRTGCFRAQGPVLAGDPVKAKEIAARALSVQAGGNRAIRIHQRAEARAVAAELRIDSGVVTETMLNKLPRGTAHLVLAPASPSHLWQGPRPRPWPHLRKDLTMIRGHVIGR